MEWTEAFLVFVVTHLVGDFGLQTEWQATHKRGGLGADPAARRALLTHVATYTLAFVPALVWLGGEVGAAAAVAIGALIAVPHLIQDDGRLVERYMVAVKHLQPGAVPAVTVVVDQVLHIVALFLLAIVAAS